MSTRTGTARDEFLQQRVRLLIKFVLASQILFAVYSGIESFVMGVFERPQVAQWFPLLALGLSVGGLGFLRAPRSSREAYATEVAVLLGFGALAAHVVSTLPIGFRAEYGLFIFYTILAVAHAAIIPSSALRTGLICASYWLLLVVVSWQMYRDYVTPDLPGYPALTSAAVVFYVSINWLVVTLLCLVVSNVIYGLRRDIKAAKQLGQYTLIEKLGEGGMGEVYRAQHERLRRPTAVKLLPLSKISERAIARFESEVQLTAGLTHPHTVTVFDYGRTDDGVFYYAMEYLEGANLREVVATDGAQSPARVVRILKQVAGALEEAHAVGLIHRDIKPANIMLTRQGVDPDAVKLLDFGLVRDLDAAPDKNLTLDGSLIGTPLYMAPETIGDADGTGAPADIYALGAVGFYLVTGTHVFDAKTVVEICAHHLHTEPDPPSSRLGADLPSGLDALLLACLQKSPGARPTATEVIARLADIDAGTWSLEDARAWWRRHEAALRAARRGPEAIESGARSLVVAG